MPKLSAGILMYREARNGIEVLLAHPGGPFWAKKDLGAWSIPKGEYMPGEDPLAAAKREFQEETGISLDGPFLPLGELKQSGGKVVTAWAIRGDCEPAGLSSNTFQMEWPPRSGRMTSFPEVDRWEWFATAAAEEKILAGQRPFLARLKQALKVN
jgi:predicted NUDIX family NTP pyrophosphohydrolase